MQQVMIDMRQKIDDVEIHCGNTDRSYTIRQFHVVLELYIGLSLKPPLQPGVMNGIIHERRPIMHFDLNTVKVGMPV